jgi:hypothetical protein
MREVLVWKLLIQSYIFSFGLFTYAFGISYRLLFSLCEFGLS